ncbi:MAG TPA: DUF4900 domain-containing protein [Candidatus Margulisiibacteriota bacterium]|nr:DUF4900 domain-containing protein [Candidatus Margulisiibacteriota bacterium]
MKNPSAKLKEKKGIALLAAYMVLTVLAILTSAFLGRTLSQNMAINTFKRQTRAFNLAEAGLNRALYWFRLQGAPPTGNYVNPWNGGGAASTLGTIGTYSVSIQDLGNPGAMPTVRRYKVTATGTSNNINKTLINYVQTDNFARYIWFTDRETFGGTDVWFWTQDNLNGPTHTNGHFNIYGNPVFGGEARSVDDYIEFYNNGRAIDLSATSNPPYDQPTFQSGMIFGAEQFNMPTQALNLRTAASATGGLWLVGDTTVVLNSNGTMSVTNSAKNWNNHNMALPTNGSLFVACSGSKCSSGASLTISGTLKGRLTAGSQRDMIIPNSVVYNTDPRTNPASTDTLGLISEGDIVISSSAPNNVEIDASIMALDTSFMVQNWDTISAKGTLTVYGGIIQVDRGPVGTFNGATGHKTSGYSKAYSYDTRLLDNPPPFFPTTGDYITLAWEE